MKKVLEVRGLKKSYGNVHAVRGIDLSAEEGEIFGLIGHNGAGKSTAIECILGTGKMDEGKVSILGLDPLRDRKKLFSRAGVQFQHTGWQERLKVGEACEVASSLYPRPQEWKKLLERFSLAGKEKKEVKELSGGERQKLAVVLALIPDPQILFLDELTTGLDPGARREIWKYLKGLRENGVTIILTSHYMDEVENLCGRIAILKNGLVTAQGTPKELVEKHNAKNLEDVFLLYMDRPEEMDNQTGMENPETAEAAV